MFKPLSWSLPSSTLSKLDYLRVSLPQTSPETKSPSYSGQKQHKLSPCQTLSPFALRFADPFFSSPFFSPTLLSHSLGTVCQINDSSYFHPWEEKEDGREIAVVVEEEAAEGSNSQPNRQVTSESPEQELKRLKMDLQELRVEVNVLRFGAGKRGEVRREEDIMGSVKAARELAGTLEEALQGLIDFSRPW